MKKHQPSSEELNQSLKIGMPKIKVPRKQLEKILGCRVAITALILILTFLMIMIFKDNVLLSDVYHAMAVA